MTLSFSLTPSLPPRKNSAGKVPVLVTGATGNIGSYFAAHCSKEFELRLTVTDSNEGEELKQYGEVIELDITSLESAKSACQGIDTVVHLAGQASPEAKWDSLLSLNIEGSYNMMVAAKAAGCRRLIYASSIHAISGYPPDMQVKSSDPVNPGDLYGVSKCFAEALGRYMAEREGLSVICLRIGAFQPEEYARDPDNAQGLDGWVSQRDLSHMIDRCVLDQHLRYAIFNGLSDNRFKRMDISDARELLGYEPQDDLTELNPRLKDLNLHEQLEKESSGDGPPGLKSGLRDDL